MKPKADTRIGARASREVFDRSGGRRGIKGVMEDLGLDRKAYWLWRDGTCAPNATALQRMALAGYDVVYILTGRRTQPRAECIPEEDVDYE